MTFFSSYIVSKRQGVGLRISALRTIGIRGLSRVVGIQTALALTCLSLCATAALSVSLVGRLPVEEDGPIPAALSHALFHTPVGVADLQMIRYFDPGKSAAPSTETLIDSALHGAVEPTGPIVMPTDGVGIGPALSATIAFTVFGPCIRALPRLFTTLIIVSSLAFAARFRDDRSWIAAAFWGALTVLFLIWETTPTWAQQAPLGGERSYALIGILPALHWCLELTDNQSYPWPKKWCIGILLSVQIAILGFAILVRFSPVYLILPVTVSAATGLRLAPVRRVGPVFAVPLAALLISFFIIVPSVFPYYAVRGRLMSTVWHRAFVSYGANPEWPFPGLREQYPCPQVSGGLKPSILDSNGHCVWQALPNNQARRGDVVNSELYGNHYETALRRAFIEIVIHYPKETLATFFYYKPLLMLRSIVATLTPTWSNTPWTVIAIACVQLVLVVVFLGKFSPLGSRSGGAPMFLSLGISVLIPQFVAWANPATGLDVVVLVLGSGILATGQALIIVRRAFYLNGAIP